MINLLKPLFFSILFYVASLGNTYALTPDNDSSLVRDPKKFYLEINSKVRDSKGPDKADEKLVVKGAVIKVINSNNYLIASYFTDKKGNASFKLPLDNKYKLIIQKKGYVSKIVEVNTSLPKEINNAFIFGVDIALFAEVKDLNTEVLQKPIAKIHFDKMSKQFNYDVAYTHKVNGDLKKMYKEYYDLKKKK